MQENFRKKDHIDFYYNDKRGPYGMSHKELQFYLLEQIKTKELRFKIESMIVLDNVELKISEYGKVTIGQYAELIIDEVNLSKHKLLLLELHELVIPFIPLKRIGIAQ